MSHPVGKRLVEGRQSSALIGLEKGLSRAYLLHKSNK